MADYAAVNGVAAANIEKVNGVAKASVQAVNGATTPSSGATQWALSAADAGVGYASNSDLTSWTTYETVVSESTDYRTIAYGKDGSGSALWVVGWSQNPKEVMYSSDITNTSGFSDVNLAGGVHDVCWGNDVWIAVGNNTSGRKAVYRSTDGATWAEQDISGVTGVSTATIYACGNSGSKWLIAQEDRLYSSSDGQTWALAHDFNDSNTTIYDLKYTNSTWVLLVIRSSGGGGSGAYVRTAAPSDLTDWSAEQNINVGTSARRFAAGNGKAIFINANNHQLVTVSGKTCTVESYSSGQLPSANSRDIATDGSTWVVVHDSGDISTSTDNGSNWTLSVDGLQIDGSVHNLDSVAANVYLPV
tara:strand:- start:179 stop:1258 length:1080 start_codon:yes stop_codon:yes gene_type:complete